MELLSGHWERGMWWVRVLGVGVVVKDVARHPLLFSEREGYRRMVWLGRWVVRYLPREPGV